MNADFQTIAALVIVALAATWLVARSFFKRGSSGCGTDHCNAVSRDVKDLRAKLKLR